MPISNPAELFDNNVHLPIIGVIPQIDDIQQSKDDLRLNSAIESFDSKLDSMKNDQANKKYYYYY